MATCSCEALVCISGVWRRCTRSFLRRVIVPLAMIQCWSPKRHLRNVYGCGVTEATTVHQTAMRTTAETGPQTAVQTSGWPLPGVQVGIATCSHSTGWDARLVIRSQLSSTAPGAAWKN